MRGTIQEKSYHLTQRRLNRNRAAQYKNKRKIVGFNVILITLLFLFAIVFICGRLGLNKVAQITDNNIQNQLALFGESETDDQTTNIYQELKDLADKNADYAEIYKHREKYPIDLLNGLIHNDEMLEFVKGYFDADKNDIGSFTPQELQTKNPLFIQWDKRWGYADYGDNMMAVAGCGPTSLSMAIVALTGNDQATPYNVAKFSYENGYYVSGNGSLWKLITEGATHYGLTAKVLPLHKNSLTNALDEGNVLILAMGPGKFTSSGHYIEIYGYDETGFYVNDSNSYKRSEKVWPFSEFSSEIINIWALSKK